MSDRQRLIEVFDEWVEVTKPGPPAPGCGCTAEAARQAEAMIAGLGRVVTSAHLRDVHGRLLLVAHAIENGGRYALLCAPGFDHTECEERRVCSKLAEYGLEYRSNLGCACWFDSLGALQDHLADDFLQAPMEHYHLHGWKDFVGAVLALPCRAIASDHDTGLELARRLATDAEQGIGIAPILRAIGTPLLHIEHPPTDQEPGETLWVVRQSERFGLLLHRLPCLTAHTVGLSEGERAAAIRRILRSVRWFESLGELQAHVLYEYEQLAPPECDFHDRPSWKRLRSGVRRLTRRQGDQPPATPVSARARHVFPTQLARDSRGRTFWSYVSHLAWWDVLWDIGDVLVLDWDEGWGGDGRAVLRRQGRFGFVVIGWGSCGGCDALQLCRSYREIEGVIRRVENSIRWFDSLGDLKRYVVDDAERQCSHYFHNLNWRRFCDSAAALSELTIGDGDLHLQEHRARSLFPDAVVPRSDGTLRWDGSSAHGSLIAALGTVLLQEWVEMDEDDGFLIAAMLQSDVGFALLLYPGSRSSAQDPLARCRHFRDIAQLLQSLAAQLTWRSSIRDVLAQLPGVSSLPTLPVAGHRQWQAFVDSASEPSLPG